MVNLALGLAAVALWAGALLWYFARDIRRAWTSYRTRWTRSDYRD